MLFKLIHWIILSNKLIFGLIKYVDLKLYVYKHVNK